MARKSLYFKILITSIVISTPVLTLAVSCDKKQAISGTKYEADAAIENSRAEFVKTNGTESTAIANKIISNIRNNYINNVGLKYINPNRLVAEDWKKLAISEDLVVDWLYLSIIDFETKITNKYTESVYKLINGVLDSAIIYFKGIISEAKISKQEFYTIINENIKGIVLMQQNVKSVLEDINGPQYKLFNDVVIDLRGAKTVGRSQFTLGTSSSTETSESRLSDLPSSSLFYKYHSNDQKSFNIDIIDFVKRTSFGIYNSRNKSGKVDIKSVLYEFKNGNEFITLTFYEILESMSYRNDQNVGGFLSELSNEGVGPEPIYAPLYLVNYIEQVNKIQKEYSLTATSPFIQVFDLGVQITNVYDKFVGFLELELIRKKTDGKYVYVGKNNAPDELNDLITNSFSVVTDFLKSAINNSFADTNTILGIKSIKVLTDLDEANREYQNSKTKYKSAPLKNAYGEYELVPAEYSHESEGILDKKLVDGLNGIIKGLGLTENAPPYYSNPIGFIDFVEYVYTLSKLAILARNKPKDVKEIDDSMKQSYLFIKHIIVSGFFNIDTITKIGE
jgi:hypothetical protein